LRLDATECREVVEEIASSLRPVAEGRGLELRVALPEEHIVLRTDRRMLSQIVLNLVNNKNVVEIGVREDQAKLFAALEGPGLRLHLSQKLAEVLGGRIECRSKYGVGSTFTLRIVER
jgi:signal transduction histidine kinase